MISLSDSELQIGRRQRIGEIPRSAKASSAAWSPICSASIYSIRNAEL